MIFLRELYVDWASNEDKLIVGNSIMIKPVPVMAHLIDNDKDEPVLPRVNYISDNFSDERSDNKEEDQGNSEDEASLRQHLSKTMMDQKLFHHQRCL